MDMADLEEDLAMLAGASPHNSGSWDSGTLARAGQGKTLWIGEYYSESIKKNYSESLSSQRGMILYSGGFHLLEGRENEKHWAVVE